MLSRSLAISLAIWAVGVQLNELVAAIGAYATAALVLAAVRPSVREVKSYWPLVAFVGWGLVIPGLVGHWPTGAGVARLTDWLLLPVAAAATARISSLKPVLKAAFITAGLSCIAAAAQYFGVWPPLEWWNPPPFIKIPFHRVYEPTGDGHFMAGGLLFHRLKFAEVTSLVVIAAASFGVQFWSIVTAMFAFISVALFPAARAAAGALTLALAAIIRPRWVAIVLLIIVAAAGIWKRSAGDRSDLLRAGLSAIQSHPFVGVGVGRFKPADWLEKDAPASALEHAGKSHNQFVTVAAEGGVVHALLFVLLLGWLLLCFLKSSHPNASRAGLAAVIFFVLLGLVHDPLFHAVFSQGLVLFFGVCLGLSRVSQIVRNPTIVGDSSPRK